jgi:glycosyltransferase involved in cell wall biosynthesis
MPQPTILHLTAMNSPKYGALERYFVALAGVCARHGYRTILQYETRPVSEAFERDLRDAGGALLLRPTLLGPLGSLLAVAGLIRSTRPEILNAHFVNGTVLHATPAIARTLGVQRLVATVHGASDLGLWAHRRFAYDRYDRVWGVSRAATQTLLEAGVRAGILTTHYLGLLGDPQPSREARPGIRRQLGLPDEALVVGCIAFDHPAKGLDVLLHAFREVAGRHPECYLMVVGVDPGRSMAPGVAARLGLADRIRWTGIRDEGWRLLDAADVYVQPSLSEGLGLSILEAMALGLPVVATPVGGIPEVVVDGRTGFLASAPTAEALAAALERLLTDRSRWQALGEAGRRRYLEMFDGRRSAATAADIFYGLREGE